MQCLVLLNIAGNQAMQPASKQASKQADRDVSKPAGKTFTASTIS
jgi:hypothetical protein